MIDDLQKMRMKEVYDALVARHPIVLPACNHILGHWDDGCSSGLAEYGTGMFEDHLRYVVDFGKLFKFCPRCGEAIPQPPEGHIPNVEYMDALDGDIMFHPGILKRPQE